jgi:hypothetical protein
MLGCRIHLETFRVAEAFQKFMQSTLEEKMREGMMIRTWETDRFTSGR